jgi:hypothetical protein
VSSGIALKTETAARFSVGGRGSSQFTTWSVRGRASLPF